MARAVRLDQRQDGRVRPAAVGDGQADDTAAIQAALDCKGDGKTVYLPPGTYRITKTLVFQGPRHGCLVVGHGRDTRLVWDGPEGGRMFWSNGVAYSRYVGLSWDGRGKAAVGFDHAAQQRFETEVRHEHEAFRNFTGFGIRVGHQQKVASAEILYHNCLFENCGTALAFLTFNDYDNTIDGCEFRNCGTGVLDNKGNFYARNCHFDGSRQADFVVGSEHGSSIRRCTSVGSRRFIEERGTIAPLTRSGLPRGRLDRPGRGGASQRQPGADVRLLLHPAAFRSGTSPPGQPGAETDAQQQPAGGSREPGPDRASGETLRDPARPVGRRDCLGRTTVPPRYGAGARQGLRRRDRLSAPRRMGRATTRRRSRPRSTPPDRPAMGRSPTCRPAATWSPRRSA